MPIQEPPAPPPGVVPPGTSPVELATALYLQQQIPPAQTGTTVTLPGATHYEKTSTTDVVNTVTKTDLFGAAFTIAAAVLSSTGVIEILAVGDYLNTTGVNRTIQLELKLGTQVIWDSGASDGIGDSASRRAWNLRAVVHALGTTASQQAGGEFLLQPSQGGTTGLGKVVILDGITAGPFGGPFTGAATTVDTTAAQTLTFSVTHSVASASLSMRCLAAKVNVLS